MKRLAALVSILLPACSAAGGDAASLEEALEEAPAAAVAAAPVAAVAAVNGCSGALFALEGMPASSPALVITNGHCVELDDLTGAGEAYPPPEVVVTDVEGERVREGARIILRGAVGSTRVVARKLVFATMTGTDVGIFELERTYASLEEEGLRPLLLDRAPAADGAPVSVVSGFYGRELRCDLGAEVWLREGPYRTTDGVRLGAPCRLYVGLSGSPIVGAPGHFFGLANTHFSGDGEACSIHNPCEVDPATGAISTAPAGTSYGVLAHRLYDCFDAGRGALDFRRATCPWQPTTPSR